MPSNVSTLFDLLPIGAYRSTLDGRQLRANAALVRLNGYETEAEMIAVVRDIASTWYVDPEQRARFTFLLERDGTVTDFVSEVYRYKTRERIWVRENAHVVRDAQGRSLYFEGTIEDITSQRQVGVALEESERRFRALIERSQTLTIVCDEHGQMSYVSPASRLLLGKDPQMLCGSSVFDLVHPDDRAAARAEHAGVVASRSPGVDSVLRFVHHDGSLRYFEAAGYNCLADKAVAGIVVNFRDVTERHVAQLALQSTRERAALIARQAGIGTWECDSDGVPIMWDEQMYRLRGLEPRAGVPDRAQRLALLHPDDRERVAGGLRRLDADGMPGAYEYRVRLPDGSYRWLASRSAVLRDESGHLLRHVGVNWDVTESKDAETARQQAMLAERESRTKSEFLSRMSHELRTPLNAVLGFTQLLQLEAQGTPNADRLAKLGHVRAAGEHLLTLINDMLDLSSIEADSLKLDTRPVPVAAAVGQALTLVSAMAVASDVTMHVGALDGTARADPNRLRQVLLNLLSNAVKYNRPGGQVWVESAVTADAVHLRVRDDGRGMRPDQLAHLFEPFNRLGADRDGIQGSGIGLTIVKALVGRMGGSIDVTSEPDRGTTFRVTLPAEAAHVAVPPDTDHTAAPATTYRSRSGRLLYIEDDPVNVLLVEELLKFMPGLQLTAESTGAAGVARARSLHPDLVLIDMHLPDIDGHEVLCQLRADPATATIPCIALSANAMPEDIRHALAVGFDDYWTKPIRFAPFLDALARRFPSGAGSN
jgi:PAS domain S-box-containing protein